MTWVTDLYNKIKNWQPPRWVKILLGQLNDLMIAILKEAGQQYINMLKTRIIEAASQKDWTNEMKFDYVYREAKKGLIDFSVTIKDSQINALIEFLVAQLKKQGAIK